MFCKNLWRFVFISTLGTILHFTYDWSSYNPIVGLFSAVNESTWEHLKLLFFPMLFLTLLEYFLHTELPENFLTARIIGILSGMGLIVSGFYTIVGVFGENYDFLNILLYFVCVAFSLYVENRISQNKNMNWNPVFSIALLSLLTIAFFLFTYDPPNIGLFADNLLSFSHSLYL